MAFNQATADKVFKPHIRKCDSERWLCEGHWWSAIGDSPADAYKRWHEAEYHQEAR